MSGKQRQDVVKGPTAFAFGGADDAPPKANGRVGLAVACEDEARHLNMQEAHRVVGLLATSGANVPARELDGRLVAAVVSSATAVATTTAAGARIAATTRALAAEAVGAVHWLVATRLERHLCLLTARATGRTEHLALATVAAAPAVATATITLRALGGTTALAASGLVQEPLLLVIGLVVRTERKRRAAIGTGKGFVGETHSTTSIEECSRASVIEYSGGATLA